MRAMILALAGLLAACGGASEKSGKDKVAEIERANQGEAVPVTPEPILYPDIERHQLTDPACAFAPDGGGMAPVALLMADRAVMKVSGEIVAFAPDNGVQKGPEIAWTKYDGRQWSLRFGLGQEEAGAPAGKRYEATLELRDGADRTVYRAGGYAQCPG